MKQRGYGKSTRHSIDSPDISGVETALDQPEVPARPTTGGVDHEKGFVGHIASPPHDEVFLEWTLRARLTDCFVT